MNGWRERLASEVVRRRLRELEQRDPEVRALRLILGEFKFLEWALSLGTLRDPVLRSLAPPLPPEHLRGITADEAPELFLWTGLVDVDALLCLFERHWSAGGGARGCSISAAGAGGSSDSSSATAICSSCTGPTSIRNT